MVKGGSSIKPARPAPTPPASEPKSVPPQKTSYTAPEQSMFVPAAYVVSEPVQSYVQPYTPTLVSYSALSPYTLAQRPVPQRDEDMILPVVAGGVLLLAVFLLIKG